MALPLMHLFTFPLNIQVVDQLQVLSAGNPGQGSFGKLPSSGLQNWGATWAMRWPAGWRGGMDGR